MYPLRVEYDEKDDTVQIAGHKFSGDYFRYFTPQGVKSHGRLFEVMKIADDGVIICRNFYLDGFLLWIVRHWPRRA
jgi:hypothetical protein